MNIAIYTLTSELHDEQAVSAATAQFLNSLKGQHGVDYDFKGSDYDDYGSHPLDLIYVRTGGTEGLFRQLLPRLQAQSAAPFYLLTSGKSNSLAASLEILSYLRQNGFKGEVLHGTSDYLIHRIKLLERASVALAMLRGSGTGADESCRLGIVGQPSDWLIASQPDKEAIRRRLGIELMDIPMEELLDIIAHTPLGTSSLQAVATACCPPPAAVGKALPGALQIYEALRTLVSRRRLRGFTIRCFDLLTALRGTACLALAQLNAEGIVAGCEGDVPAMISMAVAQAVTGVTGFQANPARIDPETGEVLVAHCTIPLNMVERYELDTHFESGIGVGIRGFMKEGPVTMFKLSGDLSRCFVEEGELVKNQQEPDLCRTQQVIRLNDKSKAAYFLTNPIGNHHIVLPGHQSELLTELTSMIGCTRT